MNDLLHAIKVLSQGGIVIFPTDTAYGIGCRIDSEQSVKRLFALRMRPETQAVPVLVNSIRMTKKYFLSPLPNNVRQLMEKYWPGGLTIVYYGNLERVPALVRGRGKTVGLRMPNHYIPLKLIEGIGVPILGPSANFHGKATPFTFKDLDNKLVSLVDCVLEGECSLNKASTVVDCSISPFKIIRQGSVIIK